MKPNQRLEKNIFRAVVAVCLILVTSGPTTISASTSSIIATSVSTFSADFSQALSTSTFPSSSDDPHQTSGSLQTQVSTFIPFSFANSNLASVATSFSSSWADPSQPSGSLQPQVVTSILSFSSDIILASDTTYIPSSSTGSSQTSVAGFFPSSSADSPPVLVATPILSSSFSFPQSFVATAIPSPSAGSSQASVAAYFPSSSADSSQASVASSNQVLSSSLMVPSNTSQIPAGTSQQLVTRTSTNRTSTYVSVVSSPVRRNTSAIHTASFTVAAKMSSIYNNTYTTAANTSSVASGEFQTVGSSYLITSVTSSANSSSSFSTSSPVVNHTTLVQFDYSTPMYNASATVAAVLPSQATVMMPINSTAVVPITTIPRSINQNMSTTSPLSATPSLAKPPSTSVIITSTLGIVPTPSKTSIEPPTSSSVAPIGKYYEYRITFVLINVEKTEENEDDFKKLSLLINNCKPEYTETNSPYFLVFQAYIEKQICQLYDGFQCSVFILKLTCGSLKPDLRVITTKNTTELIKNEVTKGSIGEFQVNKTTFVSQFKNEVPTKPTEPSVKEKYKPNVYVVVTMRYTWRDFCGVVEKHFKERIAERSYDLQGKKLSPSDIEIINRDEHCRGKPDDEVKEIDVYFIVIGKEQDELTQRVGNDLKDLVDSGREDRLGGLFEGKILKVWFSGEAAYTKSGLSDTEKIWLAVGVIVGLIIILLFLYMCCCRKNKKEQDAERAPAFFAMDEVDNSKKINTASDNQGFDDIGEIPAPVSTFKGENDSKPAKKEDEGKMAPLGGEEESDDELGMTVPDVAIESEEEGKNNNVAPAGTLAIIPPDPAHMAIQDLPKFLKEADNESKKSKEYEDLDNSTTEPNVYRHQSLEKNRSPSLVPKPETRVKLPDENDYINANYIKDHHGNKTFIATQHPLSNTMRDFWAMIWNENVSVVVMVNDEEKDMENYHNYWLDHKNSLTIYGHMQVRTDHMESRKGYNFTRFILQNSHQSDITKTINHFRFSNWNSEGISDDKMFAQFVRSVENSRLENPTTPIAVHCSNGQGLTGAFIASDIGLRVYNESDKKSVIDVFDCVEKMRKDRNRIVCTKELYNFIFKVLSILVKNKEGTDSKL